MHLPAEHMKRHAKRPAANAEWQEDALLNVIYSAIALPMRVALGEFFHSKDDGAEWRAGLGGHCGLVCALSISYKCARPPKNFKDAKKYGPHAELHFFWLRNTRCERDPIEPGSVSRESPIFTFPFAQVESLLLLARNDPLN